MSRRSSLLIDLDLRRPQIGPMLQIVDSPSMEKFLRRKSTPSEIFRRFSDNLAIAPNAWPVRYGAELLQSADAAATFADIRGRLKPDVILIDMPPMLANDDLMAFLPNVDCAILVAAAGTSTMREIEICERTLAEQTNVLGVVLNRCRFMPDKYGY